VLTFHDLLMLPCFHFFVNVRFALRGAHRVRVLRAVGWGEGVTEWRDNYIISSFMFNNPSPDITSIEWSNQGRWDGQGMYNSSNIGNTQKVLVDNLGEKRYFKRPRGRSKDNINIDLTEGRWEDVTAFIWLKRDRPAAKSCNLLKPSAYFTYEV